MRPAGRPAAVSGELAARLIAVRVPRDPAGAVLVLHGGAARPGDPMVSPTQSSVLLMIPVARHIARAGRGRLAVFRLLNSRRGWDTRHTPVADARWALGQIGEAVSARLPVCLVGHSLGGRAALLAADQPAVVSAVALAPWVYPADHVDAAGRTILIVHGSADRVAKPENSAAVARAMAGTATVGYVIIDGGTHSMLRHRRRFISLASAFTVATLTGTDPGGALAAVLAGQHTLEM